MMTTLRHRMKTSKDTQQEQINELNRQLKQTEERQHRLLDAIETGIVDLDETVQSRAQSLKAAREALIIEIAGVRSDHSRPIDQIKASQVEAFAKALKANLLSKDSTIAKTYLNLLVDKIVVTEHTANVIGSYNGLAQAATLDKMKNWQPKQVPTSIHDWGG